MATKGVKPSTGRETGEKSVRSSAPSSRGLSRAEARALGKKLREACPRESHAGWKAPAGRPDALDLVLEAEKGRLERVLPLRHGRMARSPFTFYRGAALTMASDLAPTPVSGIRVQACGDAHLCNFGGFATPERKIIFSINDLDETLPAPWEWDVKRLAASFLVACRDNGLRDSTGRDVTLTGVRSYRESMAELSELRSLELWYRTLTPEELFEPLPPAHRRRVEKRIRKEQARSRAEEMFPKLAEHRDGVPVIKDQLPTIFHDETMPPGNIQAAVREALAGYRATLHPSYQSLLDRFELCDAAVKVVGVGSVGTYCFVLLLMAGDDDPLFLQVKEARASVLEPYAGKSVFPNHGQRVVNGYRLMQPASDMFLGYCRGPNRDYFVRQLRDVKVSALVETFGAEEMGIYAGWCGRALALSHARSGNAAMISGYLGKGDAFDEAIASFSLDYADQNEKDHAVLEKAIRDGKVEAFVDGER